MLTGAITTYFTSKRETSQETNKDCSELIEIAQTLDERQIVELTAIAKALKGMA